MAVSQGFSQRFRRWGLGLAILVLLMHGGSAQERSYLYGGGSFKPKDNIQLSYYLPGGANSSLRIYRITNPEVLLELGGPRRFEHSEGLDLSLLRQLPIQARRDRFYNEISLGSLPIGMYFVQLGQGQGASATLVVVSDLSMLVKSDPETVLSYTAQSSSGSPRQAHIYLLNRDGIYGEGLADSDGLTRFAAQRSSSDVVVAAKYGDAWAFSDNYWQSWNLERSKVYLYTERPLYRPGQEVQFKGVARSPDGLAPIADEAVQITVYDSSGSEIYSQSLRSDAFGSVEGSVQLERIPPLGRYELRAEVAGSSSYASFFVEEFQTPEYRVTLRPEDEVAVQGDTLRVHIDAEYLFGGPVAGAELNYSIIQAPYFPWRFRSSFAFYDSADDYSYGGSLQSRGQARLDSQGSYVLELPLGRQEDGQAYRLTIQAGVSDEARREISASTSLIVYPSEVVLSLESDRYAYQSDESAQLTVRARNLEGEPVSVPFNLSAERFFWERGSGQQRVAVRDISGHTDSDGVARLSFDFPEQGSYQLQVSAEDAQGRRSVAERSVWVSSGSYWYWSYSSLSMEADKEEYQVGETARFVIQSPVENAHVLISHEGQRLGEAELVQLEGSVLTYELTVTEDMAPNAHLGAAIIGDDNVYYEVLTFRVPPVEQFLELHIESDAERYRPGDTAQFALQVRDQQGQGVAAQLSIGIVDEGIYLLREDQAPDIRGFFYALRSNVVGTSSSDWYYFGAAEPLAEAMDMAAPSMARAAMDEAVFAQSKDNFAEAELREDFRDSILWLPTLETDADGRAHTEVVLPDNLTEWRLTARVVTLGSQVGQGQHRVMSTLPVIARLAAPRFMVRGDEASVRVIGQNTLESEQNGQLELSSDGLLLQGSSQQPRVLPAQGSSTADFMVQALESGSASLTARALTPVASDAMLQPMSVLPRGIREDIAWAASLYEGNNENSNEENSAASWQFQLPQASDLRSLQGTLQLNPSFIAVVAPALRFLVGFPYGCTEQTMSRFLPSVLASQVGDVAQLPPEIAEQLDDLVAAGLQRLYDFQQDDGGWGFWQHSNSNPFISAYVMSGLLQAQEAGYQLDAWVLRQGLNYIEASTRRTFFERFRSVDADAHAYAYYVLARANRSIDGLAPLVRAGDMTSYGLALSVLAADLAGEEGWAEAWLELLMAELNESSQVAYWPSRAPRYFWNDDRIEATAYGLLALSRLRPDAPQIGKLVNWLSLERRGARWVSTKDTAAVITAAFSLAEQRQEAEADYQLHVSLNGQLLLEQHIQGQQTQALSLELEGLQRGDNSLDIRIEGSGVLYSSANVSFVEEREHIDPEQSLIKVRRSYERLVLDSVDDRLIYRRAPLRDSRSADSMGDYVGDDVGDYLLVSISLDPQGEDYRYVLLNEPLPAGYRVVENDQAFRVAGLEPRYGRGYYGWNYWFDGRDIRESRIDFYFDRLQQPVTFTYILRAETPGSFTALPSHAWLMYEPEVRGVGNMQQLRVQEAPQEPLGLR